MGEPRSTGDRNHVPDFIPGPVLDEHEQAARILVATDRSLSGAGRAAPFRSLQRRILSAGLGSWWPLLVWLAAAACTTAWLAVDPNSAAMFTVACLATVLAVLSSLYLFWRIMNRPVSGDDGTDGPVIDRRRGPG